MKPATKKATTKAPRRGTKVNNIRRTTPMKKFPSVPLKIGDKVQANGGVHTVEHDRNGLFIRCSYGRHYLHDLAYRDGSTLVGVPHCEQLTRSLEIPHA